MFTSPITAPREKYGMACSDQSISRKRDPAHQNETRRYRGAKTGAEASRRAALVPGLVSEFNSRSFLRGHRRSGRWLAGRVRVPAPPQSMVRAAIGVNR